MPKAAPRPGVFGALGRIRRSAQKRIYFKFDVVKHRPPLGITGACLPINALEIPMAGGMKLLSGLPSEAHF